MRPCPKYAQDIKINTTSLEHGSAARLRHQAYTQFFIAFTMGAFQEAFNIFNAVDTVGLAAQFNEWGAHVETDFSNSNDRSTGNYAELRDAVLMQGAS